MLLCNIGKKKCRMVDVSLFDMEGTNTKLNVDVEMEKGSLEITLKDNDENILFSEVISETTSFNVDVPKNVIVSVSGKEHDGGFKISY